MAQRLVTDFISTPTPGAYNQIIVQSQPVGLGSSGNVVIVGEADGGDVYSDIVLKDNSFTPDQLDKVQQQYISGPIVDAFRAFSAPSADTDIVGSANRIWIVKTNAGTKASAEVDTNYGLFSAKNWGIAGNQTKYQITSIAAETPPTVSGSTISAFGAPLNADSFSIRLNGGAASVITLSSSAGDHNNLANLILELNRYTFTVTSANATVGAVYSNNGQTFTVLATIVSGTTLQTTGSGAPLASGTLTKVSGTGDSTITFSAFSRLLPDGISAGAGSASNSLKLTMNSSSTAYRDGFGRSFELIDSTPGDLAAIGLVAGTSSSSAEAGIEVQISRADIGLSETIDVSPNIALFIGYQGTTALLTIDQSTGLLTVTRTGGSGANLSVDMSQYKTVADLAAYINAQTGYSSSASAAAQQLPPSALDEVTNLPIASSVAGGKPGRVKDALYSFEIAMNSSRAVDFTAQAGAGIPAPMASPAFLAGGLKGSTSAAESVAAINALAGLQVNIVVPLFSRDASADIIDGLTDPASTYTIDAIHAATKSHVIQYSTPKLKRNRIAILSFWGSYTDTKQKAQNIAQYRCSLAFQRPSQVNSQGQIISFLPWYQACLAAGMQAGGFYKAIVNKFANTISFLDPDGFDSGSPGDVEDALDAGLLFWMQENAGARWVSDQTTYGFDANFVYNSIQAVYVSDILALDLTDSFQRSFVGKSLADVDASTALTFLAQKMDGYKRLKMIAGSADAPLGYKNAKVSILAPTMTIAVEIKLATAIYFVPITINISQIQQTA